MATSVARKAAQLAPVGKKQLFLYEPFSAPALPQNEGTTANLDANF